VQDEQQIALILSRPTLEYHLQPASHVMSRQSPQSLRPNRCWPPALCHHISSLCHTWILPLPERQLYRDLGRYSHEYCYRGQDLVPLVKFYHFLPWL
jgi:hypothetical protein